MRYALMIEPQQGMTYADQLAVAERAERAGFETLFRSDHYDSFPGALGSPTTDAWAVLAGLARDTRRIRLGALVSPVTFRHPGNLAKIVATVDEMSGGRIEFGIGAGWNEGEHDHHGFVFPPISERADMVEEQLAIVRGLWQEPDGWSFEGKHWSIPGSLFRPKPVQHPTPPIIVGGMSRRSLRIAARLADEYNVTGSTPDEARTAYADLEALAREAGREPGAIVRSVMAGVLVGRDAAEVDRRTTALMALFGQAADGAAWLDERRPRWVIGTPVEARAQVAAFAAAGCQRIMLQDFLPWDLDQIDELAEFLF